MHEKYSDRKNSGESIPNEMVFLAFHRNSAPKIRAKSKCNPFKYLNRFFFDDRNGRLVCYFFCVHVHSDSLDIFCIIWSCLFCSILCGSHLSAQFQSIFRKVFGFNFHTITYIYASTKRKFHIIFCSFFCWSSY